MAPEISATVIRLRCSGMGPDYFPLEFQSRTRSTIDCIAVAQWGRPKRQALGPTHEEQMFFSIRRLIAHEASGSRGLLGSTAQGLPTHFL